MKKKKTEYENSIYKPLNMINFLFETCGNEEEIETNYSTVLKDLNECIENRLSGSRVYLDIDFNSDGGYFTTLMVMLNKFRTMKKLGIEININICGDLISCGCIFLLIYAKEQLGTISWDSDIFEPIYVTHSPYSRLFTNELKDKDNYTHYRNKEMDKVGVYLLEIYKEFCPPTEKNIDDYTMGRDIILDNKMIKLTYRNLGVIRDNLDILQEFI